MFDAAAVIKPAGRAGRARSREARVITNQPRDQRDRRHHGGKSRGNNIGQDKRRFRFMSPLARRNVPSTRDGRGRGSVGPPGRSSSRAVAKSRFTPSSSRGRNGDRHKDHFDKKLLTVLFAHQGMVTDGVRGVIHMANNRIAAVRRQHRLGHARRYGRMRWMQQRPAVVGGRGSSASRWLRPAGDDVHQRAGSLMPSTDCRGAVADLIAVKSRRWRTALWRSIALSAARHDGVARVAVEHRTIS